MRKTESLEGAKSRSRDKRPGAIGRDDPLSGSDAGRAVAARGALDPVFEVARGQRDVAGGPGGSARGVDADDVARCGTEVGADRILGRAGRLDLILFRQGQLRDAREFTRATLRVEPCGGQLSAIEAGVVKEIRELGSVSRRIEDELLRPRERFGVRSACQRRPSSDPRWYSTASSAFAAM